MSPNRCIMAMIVLSIVIAIQPTPVEANGYSIKVEFRAECDMASSPEGLLTVHKEYLHNTPDMAVVRLAQSVCVA